MLRARRTAVEDFLAHRATPPAEERPPRSRGRGQRRFLTQAQRHRCGSRRSLVDDRLLDLRRSQTVVGSKLVDGFTRIDAFGDR